MINFRDVNKPNSLFAPEMVLGRLLRAPLRLIPRAMVLPILQGPGRGLRWIVGSYNHGCWLGSYEYEKQTVLKKLVRDGDVVYDLGAHVGYFTIILSRLVGPRGTVYGFEPLAENYEYLLKHIALNRITNVAAIQVAIGPRTGVARFQRGAHSATGKVTADSGMECPTYNLVDYIGQHGLRPPDLIKIDIEGAEELVVPSIIDYVVSRKVRLLISTHRDEITRSLTRLLAGRGYKVTPLQWAAKPSTRTPDNATLLSATA